MSGVRLLSGAGPRSGFSMVQHKTRGVLFGGVTDRDAGRDGDLIVSEFHNEVFTFAYKTRRWFPADIRPPRPHAQQKRKRRKGKGDGEGDERKDDGSESEEEAPKGPEHAAATRIQARFRGYVVRKAYVAYRVGGVVSELLYSPASYGVDPGSQDYPKPRARINAHVAVSGSDMWLYGGIVEVGDGEKSREVTLDDLWRVNLDKCDGWEVRGACGHACWHGCASALQQRSSTLPCRAHLQVVMDTTVGPEVFKDGGTSDDTDKESVDMPQWNA